MAILDNSPESASSLIFHPFEPTLVVANESDGISVWDREVCRKVNAFKNRSSDSIPPARTTHLEWVNENEAALLLAGSEDGIIRVWANCDESPNRRLVTSWRALNAPLHGRSVGLVMNWQQSLGNLATSGAGDTGLVRIWDLERESYTHEFTLPVENAFVTSMTSDPFSRLLVTGNSDGSLCIFDYRAKNSSISTLSEHEERIVNVHVPRSNPKTIVSGSSSGNIRFWDMNLLSSSVSSFKAFSKSQMSAFSVHNYAPVVACGSYNQKIKIMTFQGTEVSLIRYHDGFLGQRIGSVSCLAFHPYTTYFAAGSTDSDRKSVV